MTKGIWLTAGVVTLGVAVPALADGGAAKPFVNAAPATEGGAPEGQTTDGQVADGQTPAQPKVKKKTNFLGLGALAALAAGGTAAAASGNGNGPASP
ncbi:hypothetical protein [Novosphingobium album (ex Liu et al. 2023)]|uniref:Uncharacterized protein n=1 Tax=Novosphingobium album (ex Liu et al. 2023) TaxID=3031130 RepID=A0ABT5WS16_9SPHN|nr:hypothetical protein [Novosphingobium album (ex Liu et al. 2023)]MDE8652541.1 hypothetical protein [Novosphingobium album (ex Liu et al. 2023)]